MYADVLTTRAKAKADGKTVDEIKLTPSTMESLRVPDDHVRDSIPGESGLRFGMRSDISVTPGSFNIVVAEDGTEYSI